MGTGDSGNPLLPSSELLNSDHNFTEAADGVFYASGQSSAHHISYFILLISFCFLNLFHIYSWWCCYYWHTKHWHCSPLCFYCCCNNVNFHYQSSFFFLFYHRAGLFPRKCHKFRQVYIKQGKCINFGLYNRFHRATWILCEYNKHSPCTRNSCSSVLVLGLPPLLLFDLCP